MPPRKRKGNALAARDPAAPVSVTFQDVTVTSQEHLQRIMRAVSVSTLKASDGTSDFGVFGLEIAE